MVEQVSDPDRYPELPRLLVLQNTIAGNYFTLYCLGEATASIPGKIPAKPAVDLLIAKITGNHKEAVYLKSIQMTVHGPAAAAREVASKLVTLKIDGEPVLVGKTIESLKKGVRVIPGQERSFLFIATERKGAIDEKNPAIGYFLTNGTMIHLSIGDKTTELPDGVTLKVKPLLGLYRADPAI